MSSEKNKKKLDKIITLVQERLGDEVGGLIGASLELSDLKTKLVSKEGYFDEPTGKLIFSEIELSGEIEGMGGLFLGIKDAIRLGGTLIMLPDKELDEFVVSEDYSDEIADSYGEIANLIAGAYTSTFEEMFPKQFRFIRKNSELITPIKVDIESDRPIPNQTYYQITVSLKLNNTKMGLMTMLIPAASFGIESQDQPEQSVAIEPSSPQSQTANNQAGETDSDNVSTVVEPQAESSVGKKPFDIAKQKKRVDGCLKECRSRMETEVGELLGAEVTLSEHATRIVSKEDYFMDEASGKQVLAHMDIVGELSGKAFLFAGIKDAIHIGGTLIMLPPDELKHVVQESEFSSDCEDAYGEIANIISGVYTKVFEEQYPDKIRFVKTFLEEVVPMKVDNESDEPIPAIIYYMATAKIKIGSKELGNLQMLLPAETFKLDALVEDNIADDGIADKKESSISGKADAAAETDRAEAVSVGDDKSGAEFLVVSNNPTECAKITAVFNEQGVIYKILDFKDNVNNYLPGQVKAIFLVMKNVDEKGLGVAIKISSSSSLPLIAAGPEWTRTKVIKAVKYGVDDILLTPAEDNYIIEKLTSLQSQKAA